MEEPNSAEWQAPPPPEKIDPPEAAQMSEAATLGNIFFEPGRTFEDLKRKPRFILAAVIIALLVTAFGFGLHFKVGDDGMRRFINEQIDKNPRTQSLTGEQKANAVSMQMTIAKVVRYALPIFVIITLLIGGLLYWLAAKAFGGTGSFLHGLSVWVYSSLPPTVVSMIANYIILAFKSVDDIDLGASQRGVVHANPGFLVDSPVLATLIGTIDVFFIWGWILAAIGLRITNKLSSGSAWAIVVIFALLNVTFRVIGAYFSGNAN